MILVVRVYHPDVMAANKEIRYWNVYSEPDLLWSCLKHLSGVKSKLSKIRRVCFLVERAHLFLSFQYGSVFRPLRFKGVVKRRNV